MRKASLCASVNTYREGNESFVHDGATGLSGFRYAGDEEKNSLDLLLSSVAVRSTVEVCVALNRVTCSADTERLNTNQSKPMIEHVLDYLLGRWMVLIYRGERYFKFTAHNLVAQLAETTEHVKFTTLDVGLHDQTLCSAVANRLALIKSYRFDCCFVDDLMLSRRFDHELRVVGR